jgi:hypothetical protein
MAKSQKTVNEGVAIAILDSDLVTKYRKFESEWTASGIPEDAEARRKLGESVQRLTSAGCPTELLLEYVAALAES